jgi:hypothetical protein
MSIDNKVAGIMMLMGIATLAMIVFPIWINSPGENPCIERVSVNHVPQKTPITSEVSTRQINSIIFNFIRQKAKESCREGIFGSS